MHNQTKSALNSAQFFLLIRTGRNMKESVKFGGTGTYLPTIKCNFF